VSGNALIGNLRMPMARPFATRIWELYHPAGRVKIAVSLVTAAV
jgi:hypothetical protein